MMKGNSSTTPDNEKLILVFFVVVVLLTIVGVTIDTWYDIDKKNFKEFLQENIPFLYQKFFK